MKIRRPAVAPAVVGMLHHPEPEPLQAQAQAELPRVQAVEPAVREVVPSTL